MGASPSRQSWPPHHSRRGHLLALLRIHGHPIPHNYSSEVSQAAEVITDILEHIFTLVLTYDDDDPLKDSAQLAIVSRVNRHWNKVAERLLYRSVTVTDPTRLTLLARTIQSNPKYRDRLIRFSVPVPLRLNAPRTHNAAGLKLSKEQLDRERDRARVQLSNTMVQLLGSLTSLNRLEIHAKAIPLLIHSPEGPVRPDRLDNLSTLQSLNIVGEHDGRWLFLLKYAINVTSFRASPVWHVSDEPGLPFTKWKLKKLALSDGCRFAPEHFHSLIGRGGGAPPRLTELELVDVPYVFTPQSDLADQLIFLAPTLTSLKIFSSKKDEIASFTSMLATVLPNLTALTHLETNAYSITAFPPSLKSLVLSLVENKSHGARETRPIGTIYSTVMDILDIVSKFKTESGSTTQNLKTLRVEDAMVEDYLHFHLVGSNDYGDEREVGRQNRLWMRAGMLGVMVVVEKFQPLRRGESLMPSPI